MFIRDTRICGIQGGEYPASTRPVLAHNGMFMEILNQWRNSFFFTATFFRKLFDYRQYDRDQEADILHELFYCFN